MFTVSIAGREEATLSGETQTMTFNEETPLAPSSSPIAQSTGKAKKKKMEK